MNDRDHDGEHDVKGVIAHSIPPAATELPATTTTAGVTPGSAGVIAHPIPPAATALPATTTMAGVTPGSAGVIAAGVTTHPIPTATTTTTPPAPGGFLYRVIDALQERARSMLLGATLAPPDPMTTSSKFSAGLDGPAVSIPDQREDLLVADLQMKWNRPSKPAEPRPDMWR